MYIPFRGLIIKNLYLNFIKYILLAQIIYSAEAIAKKFDRSNPEAASNLNQVVKKTSKEYMIVTADKRASLAAQKILLFGGNALDAAIAAQNVLAVVEPQSSGIGGGGFLLFYNNKEKKLYAYDGRETSSSLVKSNMFLIDNNKKMNFIDAVQNPYSVGIPGLYTMLADAHLEHGHLSWRNLFESSLYHAENFQMGKRLNKLLSWAPHIKENGFVRKTYFFKGEPIKVGNYVKNIEIKQSLEALSLDPYSLKSGILAKKIASQMPNYFLLSDLKNWKTIKRDPLCKTINSYKVCGFPPPTSGGVGVIQILGILNYKKNLIKNNKPLLAKHFFIESSRLAYKDRNYYIADPLFFDIPINQLISDSYLFQRSKLINENYSSKNIKHGDIEKFESSNLKSGNNFEKTSTTHISIIDKEGNVVSLTSSIEFAFGSGITVGGFFLNNQLTDFSFMNKNDKGELVANRIQPNKKPRSSMSPTIIFNNNNISAVIGSPGGSRIICYVAKVAYEIIFLDRDPLFSVQSPHFCSRDAFTELEKSDNSNELKDYLSSKGHSIKLKDMTSGLNIIWKKNNIYYGVADPRREGVAIGE